MGTTTKNLGLYKPAANDYYNVEKDQNENFDKIDAKFGEVDNGLKEKLDKGSYGGDADELKREIDGKEPAFSKNSGFNKTKTSEYKSGKDAEKLFTQEGAHNLYEEVKNKRDVTDNDFESYIDINGNNGMFINFKDKGTDTSKLDIGYSHNDKMVRILNRNSNKWLIMKDNGDLVLQGSNFKTSAKEVVGAVNELLENDKRLAGLTNIRYVQDTWTKEVGDICVDKVTKKLYGVKYRTNDKVVSPNFYELTVGNLFKKTTEFKVTTLNTQVPRSDSSATPIPYDKNYRYITIVGYCNTTYAVETNQVTVDCYMTNKLGNDYFYTLPLYYQGARQCTIKVRARADGIRCSAWSGNEPQGYIAKAIYHN